MVTSVLVCLAYAIPASRPILVDLVGENLIIKSMQPLISNKLFIIGLVCLAGIMLVEIDTQVISNAILQTEIASHTKSYEAVYGVDPLQWPEDIKYTYIKECNDICTDHFSGGIITKVVRYNHNVIKYYYQDLCRVLWEKDK